MAFGPFYGRYLIQDARKIQAYNDKIELVIDEIFRQTQYGKGEALPPKYVASVYEYLEKSDINKLNSLQISACSVAMVQHLSDNDNFRREENRDSKKHV